MKQYVGFVCIDDNINPYYKVHCVLDFFPFIPEKLLSIW